MFHRAHLLVIALLAGCTAAGSANRPEPVSEARTLDLPEPGTPPPEDLARRFMGLALDCVHREYPNLVHHVLEGPDDVAAPHVLTPAFYGCYDWHSAVHGHWLLARLARLAPGGDKARAALGRSLTAENIAREVGYVGDRPAFERPYGLAWLLQLAAELHAWDDPEARGWSAQLRPLAKLAVDHLSAWLPKLSHPIRSGEHSQTAFAMGLALDYARTVGDREFETLLVDRAGAFHLETRDCPIDFEPSGHDFLSPCLGEADLVRRLLPPEAFARWLSGALPGIASDGRADWLPVAAARDRTDGKLAHLDGLNLSRAWMLVGIASGLPDDDARIAGLLAAAKNHREAGLAQVTGDHYAGGHWLGSFAVYLTTGRGLAP